MACRQGLAGERSFEAAEFATPEWVDWFNRRRLLEPMGKIPPAKTEENYYAMMDCLVPAFGGAVLSPEWKEALWDKFFTAAPQRQRQSVEQYKIVKRA